MTPADAQAIVGLLQNINHALFGLGFLLIALCAIIVWALYDVLGMRGLRTSGERRNHEGTDERK